jgi:hypothetical protein
MSIDGRPMVPGEKFALCAIFVNVKTWVITVVNGDAIVPNPGQEVELHDVEVRVLDEDLRHWEGDPRGRYSGKLLLSRPVPGVFDRGALQIFRCDLGRMSWTAGYQSKKKT